MLAIAEVERAATVLAGIVHRTPVLTSATLDAASGAARVYCKGEHLQRGGSFKLRGAYHALAALRPAQRARGVVAYSSGNHAQAVALAARLLDTAATIVMPHDAPAGKVAATREYGAEIVGYDRFREDRVAIAERLARDRGATLVPPFDHPAVMAGQGTVALELLEQAGDLDVLLVPVGGGGLAAGCAVAAHARLPGIDVVGVEPEAGDDTRRSLTAGRRVRIPVPRTIADGLQLAVPGALTFPVLARHLAAVAVTSDAEITTAMGFAFERMKAVLEPSGACALAALLAGRVDVRGRRVGVVLSGGNVDVARFCTLVGADGQTSVRI
jgi:threo-3-hydroxy-L-aspartate ammonia-lyase